MIVIVIFNYGDDNNSFIHTEHLYSASSRELLRGAPDSSTAKKSNDDYGNDDWLTDTIMVVGWFIH